MKNNFKGNINFKMSLNHLKEKSKKIQNSMEKKLC